MVHSSDCQVCKKEVTDNCKGLECESCDDWYHAGCVGIPNAVYKGLVSGNGNDKIGFLLFCKTCSVGIRGFIRSSSARPLTQTQTNEDSPKGLSQRSPNSEILNSEQGNNIKSNPTTSKNDKQEWKTVKNSSKQPKGAVKSHIVETKNKYSILGRLEDSIDFEFMLVEYSIIKEQVDIFCNRGRKMRSRLCIPGGNINNISDVVGNLGDTREHIITHVGTNNLVQRSYGYRNRHVPNRNSEEIHKDFRQLINTLGQRNKKSFLVRILPRINKSNAILGRALSMSNRVKELYKASNVDPTYEALHSSLNMYVG